jgi:hypothetical protein
MLKIEKGGLCEEKLHVEVMLIERNVKMFELEKPWRFVVAEMEIREAFSSSHSLFFRKWQKAIHFGELEFNI